MSVTVRRLEHHDRDRWLELWQGYLRFYRVEVSGEVNELTFQRLRDGSEGLLGLVAADPTGEPVGLANLVFHPNTWSVNGVCYLEDLYVDPSERGGGASRALFEAVFAAASARGVEKTTVKPRASRETIPQTSRPHPTRRLDRRASGQR